MTDFAELVVQCENALRSGKVTFASEHLRLVKPQQVPREYQLPLANLCRRCGLCNEGLRLLSSLVRPADGMIPSATIAERAEYAMLLMKIGSIHEAKAMLAELSGETLPEAEMYQAFCEMALWNYEATIPLLKKYLSRGKDPYQAMVARVNLAAALIWTEHFTEAHGLLDDLISETEQNRSFRLLANVMELRSQLYLQLVDYEACEHSLKEARKILISHSTSDQLFISKWSAICSGLKTKSLAPLQNFRTEALSRQHWETVRECDFFSLKISFNDEDFQKLFCGTPYESYRVKVCRALDKPRPAGLYQWGTKNGPFLDLQTANQTAPHALKGGKKIHQLLSALLRDFYKPISLGAVFNDLFPDEYYNVFSSPTRIHQIISRTRRFFEQSELPVKIETLEAGFLLRIDGSFSFHVPFDRTSVAGPQSQIEKLKQFAPPGQEAFSADQVSQVLQLSRPTARRILKWGVENSKIIKIGAGPTTRYKLKASA